MAEPLSYDAFVVGWKFFEDTGVDLVEAKLALAHAKYGGCADYSQYHGIVGNHTAHLLAIEPGGHTLKVDSDGNTVYSLERDDLLKQVPRTGVVIDSCP